MKLQVGKTYLDKAGCMVEIIYKMRSGKQPYIGIVNWELAKCKSSRDAEDDVDQYSEGGSPGLAGDFDLVREIKKK